MNKHTPGPWKIVRPPRDRGLTPALFIEGETRISDTICAMGGGNIHFANAEANAHLIAAAPDLYACLENLYFRGLIGGTDSDVLDEVKDVLFKASNGEFDPNGEKSQP